MTMLRIFAATMAGRIFAILLIGVALSASLALGLAEWKHGGEMERERSQRVVDRMVEYVNYLEAAPPALRAKVLQGGTRGIQIDLTGAKGTSPDPVLTRRLSERLGEHAQVQVDHTPITTCLDLPDFPGNDRRPSAPDMKPAACWLFKVTLKDGARLKLSADTYPLPFETGRTLDPIFLLAIALAAGLLAVPVSRMAVAPVDELARAAAHLGPDLNSEPLPETGPREVREAARAFNAMQRRLQSHIRERTQMLAAITHDLQTPITRMRLRLEKVTDPVLHDRLVHDLAAMQAMVKEGLDLARSVDSPEAPVVLDLDSMLESLVEDAADAGHPVVFTGGSDTDVRVRPQSLRRCLSNLIDNALKYGGGAEVSAARIGDRAVVCVKDYGPGIPEHEIECMFRAFARMETSRSRETGGVGLGLTIARNLAEREGATLSLRNHAQGGIEAVLSYPAAGRHAEVAADKIDSGPARPTQRRAPARRSEPRPRTPVPAKTA